MPSKPRIYTVRQVDAIIPRLSEILPSLRKIRDQIVQVQNQFDVEEITSHGLSGKLAEEARRKMDQAGNNIQTLERDFERMLRVFEDVGCELKGLDPGLVDFFSERSGELVYLCWREDESHVGYWHTLTGGFTGRQPLA